MISNMFSKYFTGTRYRFLSCSSDVMRIYLYILIYIYIRVCFHEGKRIYVCAWVIVIWCSVFFSRSSIIIIWIDKRGKEKKKNDLKFFSLSLSCSLLVFSYSIHTLVHSLCQRVQMFRGRTFYLPFFLAKEKKKKKSRLAENVIDRLIENREIKDQWNNNNECFIKKMKANWQLENLQKHNDLFCLSLLVLVFTTREARK